MAHPMISEIEPSLGLDPITTVARSGVAIALVERLAAQARVSRTRFPTIAPSERRAITHGTTTADVRRAITHLNSATGAWSRASGGRRFLLRRLKRRHEFVLCQDAVVVCVGRIEIRSDSRMCLRFSFGHFASMTHIQLVEYFAEVSRLCR
jgi:hypothetical protein